MSNLPNSYEELQQFKQHEKSSKKRRHPLLRTIIISVLSAFILLLIWLLYPLPAPDFAIRAMLPKNSAVSIESHKPAKLWKELREKQYLQKMFKQPFWEVLENAYATDNATLQSQLTQASKLIDSKIDEVVGIKNCLAIAGSVAHSENGRDEHHGVIWLDNIGFLLLKIAFLTQPTGTYSNIKYIKLKLGKTHNLYIAQSAYPRVAILTTDLASLNTFNIPSRNSITTEFNSRSDLIEANIYPKFLQKRSQIEDGEISVRLDQETVRITGNLKLSKSSILPSFTSNAAQPSFETSSSAKGLNINLKLPQDLTLQSIQQIFQQINKSNKNPILKALTDETNNSILKSLNGTLSLNIHDTANKSNKTPQTLRLYFGVNDASKASNSLYQDLNNTIKILSKDKNLLIQMLATQLTTIKDKNTIIFRAPMLPNIKTIFKKDDKMSYGLSSPENTPVLKPKITLNPHASSGNINWKHSTSIIHKLKEYLPRNILLQKLPIQLNTHTLTIMDSIKFLDSSEVLSFAYSINVDNKQYELTFNIINRFKNEN